MQSSKIRAVVWICAGGCGILSVCKKRSTTAAERRAFMEKTINQPKKAALYCRLSVDDGRSGESISIESQKILLKQYCKSHGITDYEVYDDDGYSGTNFNRPAFERMREDIENGLIHTVIVKDQSRFGRSYIEVGMYVEEFKDKGVRFIAVDDGYDSTKSEYDMMFPMRNVINEYYAREASKKTKSAKRAKAKEGQYIGSRPPFGYKLDPDDRHHLVIDEPAAETVRRIFRLAAQGVGYNRMTKMFREEKLLTPIAYFNQHNPDYYKADYWRGEFDWHVTSIRVILENEVYLGKLVYGKQKNKSMKSKEKVKCPRDEWIVVENCHEPIISQELWDTVHKILSAKHRPTQSGKVQIFAGLVYCSDCGHALTYSQKKKSDGTYHGAYSCWMYKTHGKEYCASHYITYDVLYQLVFCDLQKMIVCCAKDIIGFRKMLRSKCKSNTRRQLESIVKEAERKQTRLKEIDKILSKLYEDSALGKIPESRYEQMSEKYEQEQKELSQGILQLKQEFDEVKKQKDASDRFINIVKKYTYINELDANILNELIDRIVVHHKEKDKDGRTYQQIEIYYRFIGRLKPQTDIMT